MTRITNFGRKRTYLEASQDKHIPDQMQEHGSKEMNPKPAPQPDPEASSATIERHFDEPTSEPPTKRRKRLSRKIYGQREGSESEVTSGAKRGKNLDWRKKVVAANEARRLKRIKQKFSETTCFACREKGHAAKDCPKAMGDAEGQDGRGKSKIPIGICYRCGSERHSLSRCKKPSNPDDPFPFASCFVCNGKGHLASGCSQNKGKGIYPNGGCCKLCGETTHLARNCTMRQKGNDNTVVIGTAREAGADEDDFHTFKRTTLELERAEKREEKVKKMLEVKKGVISGVVVRSDKLPSAKKNVVVFK